MQVMINDIPTAFKNAHSDILARYAVTPKMKVIIQVWYQIHGVRVIREQGHPQRSLWVALEFKDKEHFMEWYLKWS